MSSMSTSCLVMASSSKSAVPTVMLVTTSVLYALFAASRFVGIVIIRQLNLEICDAKLIKKVKSNYFIVRPKVDQKAGLLSLPHLGNFRRTAPHLPLLRKHSPEGTPVLKGVHF